MTRENVGPLLNEVSALVTDTEKAELPNALLQSLPPRPVLCSQTPEGREVWRKEDFPLVEEGYVRDYANPWAPMGCISEY